MLFSGNLLKRYVNIKDQPENIANYLTLKTCEIEEIHTRKIPSEVVIGYVTKCEKHPDADKLFVTEVDCGDKGKYQIVTWAENIKSWIYVPVALPGAYLPAKDLKIKPVKMRWIESNGMICSKEELWIKEDLDIHGIWILDEDLNTLSKEDLWKPLALEVPFLDNFVFDIDNKTLTNRPDLTGHLWQAIELNAIYSIFSSDKIYFSNINQIFQQFFDSNIFDILEHSDKNSFDIYAQTPRVRTYVSLLLKNVKVKKSDFKTRLDLIDLDEEPINNWVDFSNLFMFLTGQPIHFFDAAKVNWPIKIQQAKGGEKFLALDDKEYTLNEGDIIITDNEKILALAWVIGWKSSAIDETTKDILVEIANFDPIQIRKTWNAHALRTQAKIRFEKNISPLYSLYALLLFLDQLKLSGLDYELGGISYFYSDDVKSLFAKKVRVNFEDLRNFSGLNIDDEKISEILTKLWFRLFKVGEKEFDVLVPAWRSPADINIPEDIYEEVIRIYGYENIEGKDLTRNVDYVPYTPKVEIVRLGERIFVEDFHFALLETYPWFDLKFLEKVFDKELEEFYPSLLKLKNPTAPEFSLLRNNILLNHLKVVEKNFRNYDKIQIVETGKVFSDLEQESLSLTATMYQKDLSWWKQNNIFTLKNALDKLLKDYNLKWLLEVVPLQTDKLQGNLALTAKMLDKISHPKQKWLILLNKQPIWLIATLHPYYHKNLKISENSQISFMEINLDKLIELKSKSKQKPIQKLDYYTLEDQIVERDLSFVLPKDAPYGPILQAIIKPKQVIDYEVFDIYDLGDQKSISVTIKIYGENMTSEEINQVMQKVIKEVEKVWGKLRE